MAFIQAIRQSHRSRIFALLALLFVFGLQSVEATHSHADNDGAVECLSCKTSSVGVALTSPAPVVYPHGAELVVIDTAAAPHQAMVRIYNSRGPPHFS